MRAPCNVDRAYGSEVWGLQALTGVGECRFTFYWWHLIFIRYRLPSAAFDSVAVMTVCPPMVASFENGWAVLLFFTLLKRLGIALVFIMTPRIVDYFIPGKVFLERSTLFKKKHLTQYYGTNAIGLGLVCNMVISTYIVGDLLFSQTY